MQDYLCIYYILYRQYTYIFIFRWNSWYRCPCIHIFGSNKCFSTAWTAWWFWMARMIIWWLAVNPGFSTALTLIRVRFVWCSPLCSCGKGHTLATVCFHKIWGYSHVDNIHNFIHQMQAAARACFATPDFWGSQWSGSRLMWYRISM